jgi:Zn-dependent membrane protease YugP
MYLMYYDQYFLLFVIPAMLFAAVMQILLKSTYAKMSKKTNARRLTGADAAARVLSYYNIQDVRVIHTPGRLTDHYDPRSRVIALSDGVWDSSSIAAVGIAAHEAGHAAQHAGGYLPIKIRNKILPVCNIGSALGLPLAIVGYVIGLSSLVTVGLVLFSLVCVFQLITLPVEFNASARALRVITETDLLAGEEYKGAKRVLQAAAMTYVAALAVSIANFLRFLLRFRERRR